jgi:membrane-associated phospholipid phosphatase
MSKNYFTFLATLILFFNFPQRGLSQVKDSVLIDSVSLKNTVNQVSDRKSFKSFIPGIAATGYGLIALTGGPLKNFDHYIQEKRNERRPNFSTHADDYLRYVPFVALYGLEALGVKGKHRIADKTGLMLLSGVLVMGSVSIVKKATDKERPDHSDFVSFPSGHAAIAFAGAELINQEYGDLSPWYSVAGYTVASATAVLRVYNNAHWFSDVVAGAGIGILSTKVAYLVYPPLKRLLTGQKNLRLSAAPFYQNHAAGLSIAGKF